MKKCLFLLFLMAIGTSVYASTDGYIYNYYNGNYGEFYTDNGVLFVKNCDGSTKDMLVRFPQYKNITSYTVPDNVKIIARGAFQGNRHLETIRIPSTIIKIGDNAFDGCQALKSIEVYNSDSAIEAVEMDDNTEKKEIGRYNINGVKVEEKDGGIQIILYSDGSADKVIEQP